MTLDVDAVGDIARRRHLAEHQAEFEAMRMQLHRACCEKKRRRCSSNRNGFRAR